MGHQGRGIETRQRQGVGKGASHDEREERDLRGVVGCSLASAAIIVEVVGYLISVSNGLLVTILCVPLFIVSIVLSRLSLRSDELSRLGKVGMSLGVGGLACSVAFFWYVGSISLFAAFDPSLLEGLGPLSLLNWH